jgi:hypothetical protein
MHTVGVVTSASREEIRDERCRHCHRFVIWLNTCHNLRPLAFDPEPLPRRYDDGQGWAPGQFLIRRSMRTCFAPMSMHPPAKRSRIANVMRLHNCRQAA